MSSQMHPQNCRCGHHGHDGRKLTDAERTVMAAEFSMAPAEVPKCTVCGRRDREGPDGGRRVGPLPEWNESGICLPCAAWAALAMVRMKEKIDGIHKSD